MHALCPGTRIEWAEPGEVLRAYPRSDQAGDRVLLVLADGSAVVVPLLPEFIAEKFRAYECRPDTSVQ